MNATNLSSPDLCHCFSTAPSPNEEASAATIVSRLGSKRERIGAVVSVSLILVKVIYNSRTDDVTLQINSRDFTVGD